MSSDQTCTNTSLPSPLAPSHMAGFSLLEVMVAIVVLAVGLMAAAGSMVSAVTVDDSTQERDLALQAIESKLEDILTSSFGNASNFAGFHPVAGLNIPTGRDDVLQVTVTPLTGFENSVLVIDLTATWVGQPALETMTLQYALANRGG